MFAGCQEETGRANDRLQPKLGRLHEITVFGKPLKTDPEVRSHLLLAELRREGPSRKAPDDPLEVLGRGRGDRDGGRLKQITEWREHVELAYGGD